MTMSNILASSSVSLTTRTTDSDSEASNFKLCVRERLANANWFTAAALVQVLRIILKHLKQDHGSELLEIYKCSVDDCLIHVQWELLNEIHHRRIGSPASRFAFLGALLQLLCSLVHQVSSVEVGHGTSIQNPVLNKRTSIVSEVLYWCFCKQEDRNWMRSSQYLRHKMLMLMIRLSVQVDQNFSTVVLLFQLVSGYFEDLLQLPISARHTDPDECLEGSPFLSCFVNEEEVHSIRTRHLQRQAIFLFLKCSFSLISLSKETDDECLHAASNSSLTIELQSGRYCCIKKKVLLKLSEWLQRHLPWEMYIDYELYLEKCGTFALSFLQLYMDEDDLLFEVLLHLSSLPFPVDQMEYKEKGKGFEEAKGNTIILLSNILNPVHLFHLLLAELHYDHLVLLDYLISKDSGFQCLQYILRCLRTVSNSWHLFVEFPLYADESSWHTCKKRKVHANGYPDSDGMVELSSSLMNVGRSAAVLDKGRNNNFGSVVDDVRKWTFQNAMECLLSLKKSVENLHQKNLFLYNPSALLRSLTRFEELCIEQENAYLLKTSAMT